MHPLSPGAFVINGRSSPNSGCVRPRRATTWNKVAAGSTSSRSWTRTMGRHPASFTRGCARNVARLPDADVRWRALAMAEEQCISVENLGQYLSKLEDPRCSGKVEHHLIDVLIIAVWAVVACAYSVRGKAEFGQQRLCRRDLVGLLGDVDMREHKRGVGGKRAQHLGGDAVVELVKAAAQRLAIERDAALSRRGARCLQ